MKFIYSIDALFIECKNSLKDKFGESNNIFFEPLLHLGFSLVSNWRGSMRPINHGEVEQD